MRSLQIEHVVQILIAVLIVLATMLLGIGDRSPTLTLVSLVVLLVSAYVTDLKKLFCLSQPMANLMAVGVVAVAAANAYHVDRHGQMIAVANLQSYLQYVLLFQSKTSRVYWQLALLSLGQVAIASTLVPGPLFGVMLLLYLLAGTTTFALLQLQRESARNEFSRHVAHAASVSSQTLPAPADMRTPLLYGNTATSTWAVGWGLLQQGALIGLVTLCATSLIFFFLPRWNIQNRQQDNSESLRSIGFSKKVTLGELGEVVHNADLVMRVQFFRGLSRLPFKLVGEPLFRGTVVDRYDGRSWTQTENRNSVMLPIEKRMPYVRQRITVEPLDVPELFCIFPVFALEQEPKLRIDNNGDQLSRLSEYRGEQLEFEIATTGIVNHTQQTYQPCEDALNDESVDDLLQMPQSLTSQATSLPGLRQMADRVLAEKNINPGDRVAAAKALSDWFHLSGEYFYSLEAQERDRELDPLEDFVTRHRSGHCEYFAGALVMMLRSQSIPCRMAIGFKGGEWNSVGSYYHVQQLHAHTWVEVYLGSSDIPPDAFARDDEQPPAAWLTLDPTEGTHEGSQDEEQGLFIKLRQYLDYGQVLWNNYIVGLNSNRQRQGIYDPLAQGCSAAVENLVSPKVWQARFQAVYRSPVGTFWEWYRRHWFSWPGGLMAIGFSLLVAAFYLSGRWLARRLRRLIGRGRFALDPPVHIIYRRLEAALGKQGFQRKTTQTAYEFALAVGGDLAENLEHRRVAHLPRRIVEAFYRVRFGGRTLDNSEAAAVEHALVELELALGRPH